MGGERKPAWDYHTPEEIARIKELYTLRKSLLDIRMELSREYRLLINKAYSRRRYAEKPRHKKQPQQFIKSGYLAQLVEKKMIRGIVIDPWSKKVHAVIQRGWGLSEMYAALSHEKNAVEDINSVSLGRIYLWVDGEGQLKPDIPCWKLNGYPQPLAGKGLLLGIDEAGENCQCNLDVTHVKSMITWTTLSTSGRLTAPRLEGNTFHLGTGILKTDGDKE